MDWKRWAEFGGYNRPLSDAHGRRMRAVLLHAQENVEEWIDLELQAAEKQNEMDRKQVSKRATLAGSEAYRKAESEAHVVELRCEVRLLEARAAACKKLDKQYERAWESERSHGSGVKQESRATEASEL